MRDRVPAWLQDVLTAIALLQGFRQGREKSDLDGDPMFKSAVERQLTIVGEALSRALHVAPEIGTRVTDCRQIISLRNILVHNYANVRSDLLWPLFKIDLPRLEREIREILNSWKSVP